MPERSYRRWQQRGRQGRPAKGPWPAPSADRIEPVAIVSADRYPQWGSRTIATLLRLDGHHAPDSTVYRALRRTGRVLEVDYQAERRQLAAARRAAFVVPPSGPNQVWQLDFSEFETRMGGVWRIGGVADYWSKLELGWHVSTTQNNRDAIEAVELALAETERLLGRSLREAVVDHETGEARPVALVTEQRPLLQVASLRGLRRRPPRADPHPHEAEEPRPEWRPRAGLRLAQDEHLYRLEIDDGHDLGLQVESYRQLFNTVRPHQALAGRRPLDVHLEANNDAQTTKSNEPETLPLS